MWTDTGCFCRWTVPNARCVPLNALQTAWGCWWQCGSCASGLFSVPDYPASSAIPTRLSARYYKRSQSAPVPACCFQISRMAAFQHPCRSWSHYGIVRSLHGHDRDQQSPEPPILCMFHLRRLLICYPLRSVRFHGFHRHYEIVRSYIAVCSKRKHIDFRSF